MEFRTATGERILCHCRISGLPLFVGLAESVILATQQADNKPDYETGVGIFRRGSGKRVYRISGPATQLHTLSNQQVFGTWFYLLTSPILPKFQVKALFNPKLDRLIWNMFNPIFSSD